MPQNRHSKLALLARLFIFAACVTQSVGGVTADESDELFDPSVIRDIWLEIPASSWEAIDDESLSGCEPMYRSYHPGSVKVVGSEFPGSGIRVKGGCGSSRSLDEKAAFKANLSWDDPAVEGCAESREYKGIKKFTLNNQVEDASFTHERMAMTFSGSWGCRYRGQRRRECMSTANSGGST